MMLEKQVVGKFGWMRECGPKPSGKLLQNSTMLLAVVRDVARRASMLRAGLLAPSQYA